MRALHFSPRTRRAAVLVIAALAGLGFACGKNRVLLDVDVRSFMDEGDLINPYDAPPLIPITVRLDPIRVNLVEGYKDFGTAQSVTLDVGLRYDNTSGRGHARFALFAGPDSASAFASEPIGNVDADLQPGTVSTSAVQVLADQRVLDLFTSKEMWMGIEFTWEPQSLDRLQGTCVISQITAHMVSTLDIF